MVKGCKNRPNSGRDSSSDLQSMAGELDATAEAALSPFGVLDSQLLAPHFRADFSGSNYPSGYDCHLLLSLSVVLLCHKHPDFVRLNNREESLPVEQQRAELKYLLDEGFFWNSAKKKYICFYCNFHLKLPSRLKVRHSPRCWHHQLLQLLREKVHPEKAEVCRSRARLNRLTQRLQSVGPASTTVLLSLARQELEEMLGLDSRDQGNEAAQTGDYYQSHPLYEQLCVPFLIKYLRISSADSPAD